MEVADGRELGLSLLSSFGLGIGISEETPYEPREAAFLLLSPVQEMWGQQNMCRDIAFGNRPAFLLWWCSEGFHGKEYTRNFP